MPEVSLGHDARDRSAAPARADHGEKHVRVPGLQSDANLHLAGVPDGAGSYARRRRRLARRTTRGFISRLIRSSTSIGRLILIPHQLKADVRIRVRAAVPAVP